MSTPPRRSTHAGQRQPAAAQMLTVQGTRVELEHHARIRWTAAPASPAVPPAPPAHPLPSRPATAHQHRAVTASPPRAQTAARRAPAASRSRSVSPGFESVARPTPHPFLKSHTGEWAHPDLSASRGRHHEQPPAQPHHVDEPIKQPADSSPAAGREDVELHLIEGLMAEQEQHDPADLSHLSPVPPTRYPFHHSHPEDVPQQAKAVPQRVPAREQPQPAKVRSSAPPPAASGIGTLASYIHRFRMEPPQPPSSRAAMPLPWWARPNGGAGAAVPTRSPNQSNAEYLRAMEQKIEAQREERQKQRQQQPPMTQQEKIARLQQELREEQAEEEKYNQPEHSFSGVDGVDITTSGEAPADASVDLSLFDNLDPTTLLSATPRLPSELDKSHADAEAPAISYRRQQDTPPRQPRHTILDDSDDFSAFLGPSKPSSASPDFASSLKAHRGPTAPLASSLEVDQLLQQWRAQHPQQRDRSLSPPVRRQAPTAPRADMYSSPPHALRKAEASSPEVDQLIHRLKQRLGMEVAEVQERSNQRFPRQYATIPQPHPQPTLFDEREAALAARVLVAPPVLAKVEHRPHGSPFRAVPTVSLDSRQPLADAVEDVAQRDYINSARRSAESPHVQQSAAPAAIVPLLQLPTSSTSPARPSKDNAAPAEHKEELELAAHPAAPRSVADAAVPTSSHFSASVGSGSASSHLTLEQSKQLAREVLREELQRLRRSPKRPRHGHPKSKLPPSISIHISSSAAATAANQTARVFHTPMQRLDPQSIGSEPADGAASSLPVDLSTVHFLTDQPQTASSYTLTSSPPRAELHPAAAAVAASSSPSRVSEVVTRGIFCGANEYEQLKQHLAPAPSAQWTTTSPPRVRARDAAPPASLEEEQQHSDPRSSFMISDPATLARLCAELGMTVAEYEADPPLQLLVMQLHRLQQQAQAAAGIGK